MNKQGMCAMVRWVPVCLWMGVVYVCSSQPSLVIEIPPFPYWDKYVHACVYGVMAFLLLYALRWPEKNHVLCACFAAVVLYGVSDEWHQSFVPGRSCDVWDACADAWGSACVLGAYLLWIKKVRKHTPCA